MKELEKRFDFQNEEERIYESWEESGYFAPEQCIKDGVCSADAEPFSIVLPPPNVTGTLHMGHAAMLVLEDIMVRFNRMRGRRTLWVPGTDHAAIATQSRVEKALYEKEGKTRFDLGREEFLKRVVDFAQESHDTIVNQVRRMGASVDWGREAFTLDEQRSLAVRTAFKRMYDGGLIYRGARVVNWDPKLQTTVSDDEIEWKEEKSKFYYLKYGPFTIGTARPETKFGDKYIVMHPDDERYKEYKHGQTMEVEWINGPVTATIIKDEAANPEFGTGVMTITPWHSLIDFEIAERHDLDKEQIIDARGVLLPIAQEFADIHIKKARPLIVEKLKKKGLLVKIDESYIHNVATNSRGGGIIEPQIKEQWFVNVKSLKGTMRSVVESGKIKILPAQFNKTYYHWIDNLRDWCISRQIWYGHRIPVWYRPKADQPEDGQPEDGQETYVGIEPPEGEGWEQDPDTLDTWFSSGLWTFSTLGWPEETEDLKTYHPTSVLETGYDILFFWVARMVLMTTYLLGDIPFKTVYLHGLVRDKDGKKMSKSLGNIIDPLDMIEKYGADATRLSLVIGGALGNDVKLSEDKVRGYRNFGTKIWNAARFVLMNIPEDVYKPESADALLNENDRQRLAELRAIKEEVTGHYDAFEFHLAGEKAYHYFWHTFADVIIEEAKPRLHGEDADEKLAAFHLLHTILLECLTMLHPFMPFVTEAVYQKLPVRQAKMLMVSRWE